MSWFEKRFFISALLVTIVVVIVWLDFSFGFMSTALLGLVLLLAFIFALLSAVFGLLRHSRAPLVFGVYGLFTIVFSVMIASQVIRAQQQTSFERGDVVASALSTFYSDNGRFPVSLSILVPEYLDAIPITAMGLFRSVEFNFFVPEKSNDFQLDFSAPGWMICHRTGQEIAWICDD